MKKFLILFLGLFCLSAQARQSNLGMCPFQDNMYIAGATIVSVSDPDGHVKVTKQSPTYFTISCTANNDALNGDVNLVVQGNKNASCKLVIDDGAYEQNPEVVSINCSGMQYTGVDHAWGTYDYTLKFN